MLKILVIIIACGAGIYGLILLIFYLFQEKLIFKPGPDKFGDCPEMEQAGAEAVVFDDLRYYIKRSDSEPERWFIIFDGISGNACGRSYYFDMFSGWNSNFVVFEYPGYGQDSNAPGQALILEKALALLKHIEQLNPAGLPVYLVAQSFGTGVVSYVADKTNRTETKIPKIKGLILISPYPSLTAIAQNRYPWLPVKFFMKHPFPASDWAAKLKIPVLIFHATEDRTIPLHLAKKQFKAFAGEKKMVEIAGAEHHNIKDIGRDIIREKVKQFFI